MILNHRIKAALLFARNPQLWVCIAIATFFWALNRLGNTYTSDVILPITIVGVGAEDKRIDESDIDVHSTVKANGYTTLYLRLVDCFHRYDFTIADIDMTRSADSTHFELSIPSIENALRRKLGTYVDMIAVNDSHIVVSAKNYRQKMLPVVADYSIDLNGKRMLVGPIKIEPCSVLVGGTSALIDTLSTLYTEKFKISSLRDNFEGEVRLLIHPTLVGSRQKVKYTVETEQYTEVKQEYPVVVKTESDSLLKDRFVLPENVLVTFNITKDQYVRLKPDDITLFVTYDATERDNTYIVRYKTSLKNIDVIDINPRTVTILKIK